MAARFYKQNIAQYNPLSFEEMLFAPSLMRKQHDALDASLAETQTALGNYNVLSQDQDFVNQAVDPVSQELTGMAEQLAKQGFSQQNMSQFRKLASQKNKLFSPTGEVGIAQSRLAAFQTKVKELKETYKDNPEIANYYINQLAKSPGLMRDEQGNLVNQSLASINNVRHYDAKQISDMLNSQIDNIKDTLIKDYGFGKTGSISSIQDIYREAQLTGRSAEEVNKILLAQVSPEVVRSAQQYGLVTMGSAEAGVQSLMNQVAGAAKGRASMNLDSNYQIVTNEDRKFDRDQKAAKETNNSFEYDMFSKVMSPGGIDDSYFKADQVELEAKAGKMALPYSLPINQKSFRGYKPFTKQQEVIVKDILASEKGIDPARITTFDLNNPENREILKRYYEANGGKVRITPKIENTSYLREYGGKPDQASKDLMDNYGSKQFIDSETRQVMSPKEIEKLIANGGKFNVVGVYGSGSGFTQDAETQGISPLAMTRPMAVNIVDDKGVILKRLAASRPASYFESQDALLEYQTDKIVDNVITTPNVYRTMPVTITKTPDGKYFENPVNVNVQVKFNPSKNQYEVKAPNNDFETFTTSDISNLTNLLIQNAKD